VIWFECRDLVDDLLSQAFVRQVLDKVKGLKAAAKRTEREKHNYRDASQVGNRLSSCGCHRPWTPPSPLRWSHLAAVQALSTLQIVVPGLLDQTSRLVNFSRRRFKHTNGSWESGHDVVRAKPRAFLGLGIRLSPSFKMSDFVQAILQPMMGIMAGFRYRLARGAD
jgi:hypothetical protein